MNDQVPLEIGVPAAGNTGWGLIAMHLALGFARLGRKVYVDSDLPSIPPILRPTFEAMLGQRDPKEHRIRIDAYGNHFPTFQYYPNRFRVLFCVFEDTSFGPEQAEDLAKYDLILAPSGWVQGILANHGVASTLWHQGYDASVFFPASRRRPAGPVYVFSAGKLEFRKGQDIVVEAFKRFRETPEGKDAVLVTAWQNVWPETMADIWASGYVKGVPVMRGPQLDITSWVEANGIPRNAFIDLGLASQSELAAAIRECDVGLFPNRCEGATNMALVETLACGLPVHAAGWTGQADLVFDVYPTVWDASSAPLTLACRLYRGMDGWREADPVSLSQTIAPLAAEGLSRWTDARQWSWPSRMAELNALLDGLVSENTALYSAGSAS